MMNYIALDSWEGWALLAVAALIVEFIAPTFIFLSLSLALVVLGVLTEIYPLALPMQLIVGSALWVALSLLLRKVFGNWGQSNAVEDPNQYESSVSNPETKPDA